METAPMEKQKILICGDVEGRFNALFSRVEKLNEKSGPFDLLLCVGNFFGVNNKEFELYKSRVRNVSVPTYILGPNKEEHNSLYPQEGSELCPNVTYLGKRGLYTNSGGLKIAYLSGVATSDNNSNQHAYKVDDIKALVDICKRGNSNFKGIDILLTSQWPQDVMKNDPSFKIQLSYNQSTDLTAWLAIQLKPRYHISGLEGMYYERAPYRAPILSDHDVSEEIVTRFLGLARVGNSDKQKWLYALSLTPLDHMKHAELVQKTIDETPCPYNLNELETRIFKIKRKADTSLQFFYDMNTYEDENKSGRKPKKQKIEFDQSKCWFCLASPSVEKHLVISIGETVYLSIAKGGLVDEHFLICPIEHHQCAVCLSENILTEINNYKSALKRFYARRGKIPVFFERNYKTSHMQIQCIPVPKMGKLANIFLDEAEANGFRLEKLSTHNRLDQVLQKGNPYFCVELPDGETYYYQIPKSQNFPLNFGREILASNRVLNMENRSDWRQCVMKKEEEEVLVKKIRKDFEPYYDN